MTGVKDDEFPDNTNIRLTNPSFVEEGAAQAMPLALTIK